MITKGIMVGLLTAGAIGTVILVGHLVAVEWGALCAKLGALSIAC